MIKKLQMRLIAVSMLSLLLVLIVIVGSINLFNFRRVAHEADGILTFLSDHGGTFPSSGPPFEDWPGPRPMSPELPFESRYFSVELASDGSVVSTDTARIAAIDDETAADYALRAVRRGDEYGFAGDYRYYAQSDEQGGYHIIFLDCWRSLTNARDFLGTSCWVSLAGLLAVLLLVVLLSKRFVRPISESYEKQRRFITDAGHEIKTPITIIDADAQLLEMEIGDNEWLRDIQTQSRRLADLTSDLIYLARIEELQDQLPMIEFPFSDLVSELAQSFQALASAQGKSLAIDVEPMLTLRGDEKSLRQLVSILLDNALKYSDAGSDISVSLHQQERHLCLKVCNATHSIDPRDLEHIFDRFYRADPSRNSQSGGYGIGLSIASAVVSAHKGKISASAPDENTLHITVLLPVG